MYYALKSLACRAEKFPSVFSGEGRRRSVFQMCHYKNKTYIGVLWLTGEG